MQKSIRFYREILFFPSGADSWYKMRSRTHGHLLMNNKPRMSTGLPGLDQVLTGLLPGDNVVWEVDGVEDYLPALEPFCHEAERMHRRLIYFRFARHAPLLKDGDGIERHELDPQLGFERFVTEIVDVIDRAGSGAFYVFDNLSDLAADWFSDRMLGNFFMIVCPYLCELDAIAYFALQKNQHSFHATDSIFSTAQVILEVYRKQDHLFVHPMKVWQRSSPTMYTLHSWEGDTFQPVTSSATITDIMAEDSKPRLEFTFRRSGIWVRTFQQAQQVVNAQRAGQPLDAQAHELFQHLMNMVVTREARFQKLVEKYLDLGDLVEIMQRMVGTGLIGGKSLGMLLARAILKKSDQKWPCVLESHDSFYVGSDVFYTYLVQNGCWWLRRRQKDFALYLQRSEEARQRTLTGAFPEYIQKQFMEMLEYFGQSPLIVRSSSLLEDNYGNAFSGKYESVFLANQGAPQERLRAFLDAVRTVYASAMSEEGLSYRLHHGLLDRDEQMALLVQRVSGDLHGTLFFPLAAGVGFSFNPFVWNQDIDPQAGVLRLVFGLGTRAVNRSDDDYTRLVALNAPLKQSDAKPDAAREFAQRRVDVLDLKTNALASHPFELVAPSLPTALLNLFATDDEPSADAPLNGHGDKFTGVLTFKGLMTDTDFVPTMRDLCHTLQQAYDYPVDIEFTVNFTAANNYRINLLQCRPFQVKIGGEGSSVNPPEKIEPEHLLLESHGPIIGHSLVTAIDRLIYVVPSVYSQLPMTRRYSVARVIGTITHLVPRGTRCRILLMGPGRWGTSMPALGVPVSFAEINTVSVICELALMHAGLIPDVSLGTHFFNDLVEADMLYLAVFPGRPGHSLNEQFICQQPNQLTQLLPSAAGLFEVLHVVDSKTLAKPGTFVLNVDSLKQNGVCYWSGKA